MAAYLPELTENYFKTELIGANSRDFVPACQEIKEEGTHGARRGKQEARADACRNIMRN